MNVERHTNRTAPSDWEQAVEHGQYSQGQDREDLVTFTRIDLATFLAQIRKDQSAQVAINARRESVEKAKSAFD